MSAADLGERGAQFLHLYSTHSRPVRLGVAVSGGADSVSLLHILHGLGVVLSVLHVNHGLRGFDSQNDELFVRSLSASLGLPVEVQQGPPAPGNLEAEARRIRRAFFTRSVTLPATRPKPFFFDFSAARAFAAWAAWHPLDTGFCGRC